jgi:hypothetical protein
VILDAPLPYPQATNDYFLDGLRFLRVFSKPAEALFLEFRLRSIKRLQQYHSKIDILHSCPPTSHFEKTFPLSRSDSSALYLDPSQHQRNTVHGAPAVTFHHGRQPSAAEYLFRRYASPSQRHEVMVGIYADSSQMPPFEELPNSNSHRLLRPTSYVMSLLTAYP